jgi:threonine aldolase
MEAVVIDTTHKSCSSGIGIPPIKFGDVESTFSDNGVSCFILELPHRELGGKLTPWDDVLHIGDFCKAREIRYHCDGARIFEAAAGYGLELNEVAKPFDSIYISFYKGLGAISGAMLIGEKEFCDEARIWLRRFGGNLYTLLPYFVSSYEGYRRHVLGIGNHISFDERLGILKFLTKRIREETEFQSIASFDPVIPETNMIHVYLKVPLEDCIKARDIIIERMGVSIFSRIKQINATEQAHEGGFRAKFEWTIGNANGSISPEVFVKAWDQFCNEIINNNE